jgi:ribose transport system substrate-binding protein
MLKLHRFMLLALLVLACGLVSACGDDDESTGSGGTSTTAAGGLDKVRQMAEQGRADITEWPGPDASVKPEGGKKSFVVVPCAMAAEGCKRQAEGFVEAAKELGWTTKLIDPAGDPQKQNSAMAQAITLKADGVYIVSIDPKLVSGTLKRLKDADIPVIAAATGTGPTSDGIVHEVDLHGAREGELLAAQVVDETDGKAKVALFTGNEFQTVVQRIEGTKRVFKDCPDCEIVEETDIPVTSIGTSLVSRVKSTLQANPEINVVYAPYDAAANDMVQAIQQAGLSDKVWVASFNGNVQNLDYIRKGQVQRVDIGEALEWVGWAAADNFARVFAGDEPTKDDGVPAKILVKDNLPAAGKAWTGDFDFRAKYRELWGK